MNKKIIAMSFLLTLGSVAFAVTQLTDFLQLGDSSSETSHSISGFGPVEPTTHGGNWGGMGSSSETAPSDNLARVTWSGDEPDTNDGRSAYFTTLPLTKDVTKQVCHYEWIVKEGISYCKKMWEYYKNHGWSIDKFCASYFGRYCCEKKKVCVDVTEQVAVSASTLKLRVLDGQADDNFMVFFGKTLLYEYDADVSTSEVWKTHTVDLTSLPENTRKTPMTFRIMATGNGWQYRSTYGQLGIDFVELA